MTGKTLFDKVWDQHVVSEITDGPSVLYIDRHFIHEVTSPQAFDGLRNRGIGVFRPKQTIATADHNVPTIDQHLPIRDKLSRFQVQKLTENCQEFGVELYGLGHKYQGIVHVIGPELGITQPGMTIVCGDSHTSTHGAFGAVAFGIGTSEVEQVLATQCVLQRKPKKMKIEVNGQLGRGVLSKDIILYIASKISTSGATGHFIEYTGTTIKELSMEARMTICNMSIEMGARGGMIAPDNATFEYLKGRQFAPQGEDWHLAKQSWEQLYSDENAEFDVVHKFEAEDIAPMITYGTNPGMGMKINGTVPESSENIKALAYMGLTAGQQLLGKEVNHVFIGSCTNSRIEDLRLVASLVKGRQKAPNVQAMVIPGSKQVEKQARLEGLDKILEEAGFQLRQPGCSACLGMNDDKVPSGEYCVSTSNRNYEGRQGPGARTILASPLTAAATAITGRITDVREII
ncbi:MAG: 3-isopropylmalate dehydratase large subunit [Cyclobacteriaceae bacterium]|nr:MAG: 3-isopropylmalate dehydratase large subunit [Cyclobacteriaceae bacterium]